MSTDYERQMNRDLGMGRASKPSLPIPARKPGDYPQADAEEALSKEQRAAWFAHFWALTPEQKSAHAQSPVAEQIAAMTAFVAGLDAPVAGPVNTCWRERTVPGDELNHATTHHEPGDTTMKRKTANHGTFEHEVEEFEFDGQWVSLELSVIYTLEPYDPGVRYTRNGDGWPPSGGGVEDVTCKVTFVQFAEHEVSIKDKTPWRLAKLAEVQKAFDKEFAADVKLRNTIDEACIEDAGDMADAGEADYADAKNDARDDERENRND